MREIPQKTRDTDQTEAVMKKAAEAAIFA